MPPTHNVYKKHSNFDFCSFYGVLCYERYLNHTENRIRKKAMKNKNSQYKRILEGSICLHYFSLTKKLSPF